MKLALQKEDINIRESNMSFGDQLPTIDELEEDNSDWQEKFESYTHDATPDRLLDHC